MIHTFGFSGKILAELEGLGCLFTLAKAHELFFGTSLVTKAKYVSGKGKGEVMSARWIWERMARRWWRICGVRSGAVVTMNS